MTQSVYAADLSDVRAAAARIAPFVHRTPVLMSRTLDEIASMEIFFKAEIFQRVGAFKFRGATNAVQLLDDETAARGVVTHSSGNHAQALALAARQRGIPAHIVMPTSAPAVKRRAVLGYGANVIDCEPTLEARECTADATIAATGGTLIHPYDDARIIAGQGTCALELLEDVPDLDAIVAPIGGGGLMSGTCIAARGLRPDLRLFAAEPTGADDAARSFAAGERLPSISPRTIADGLLTSLGDLTWPIVRDHAESVITVSDEEIIAAMRLIYERMKLVVEPSAAVGLAAICSARFRELPDRPARVGVILSGGNLDFDQPLPWA